DAPRDAEARGGETRERALHAGDVRKDRVFGNAHVFEDELARDGRAQRNLAVDGSGFEAFAIRRDEEAMDLAKGTADLCPDERDLRHVAVRDPALRAVDHPAVAVVSRDGAHAA